MAIKLASRKKAGNEAISPKMAYNFFRPFRNKPATPSTNPTGATEPAKINK